MVPASRGSVYGAPASRGEAGVPQPGSYGGGAAAYGAPPYGGAAAAYGARAAYGGAIDAYGGCGVAPSRGAGSVYSAYGRGAAAASRVSKPPSWWG